MIVLATELAATQPYRYGPLSAAGAEHLLTRLAETGKYGRIELVESDNLDAITDDQKRLIA